MDDHRHHRASSISDQFLVGRPLNSYEFDPRANAAQQEAISTTEGPLLIIAGPGSGKTFTLVERIAYLVTHKGVAPKSLLVVTFTEKAARELVSRTAMRLQELNVSINLSELYLGTFHSLCLRILEDFREYTRLKRSFSVLDEFEQQYLIYRNIDHFRTLPGINAIIGDPEIGRWAQSKRVVETVNVVREENVDVNILEQSTNVNLNAVGACLRCYQSLLVEQNALDFAGIQHEALELLQGNSAVLTQIQSQLEYLMVDEYQDTNTIQEQILVLLAGERQNLCVVGDDDQSLYRFRGATVRNILEFPKLFRNRPCKRVTLTTNYRSHPAIINFYNSWMNSRSWKDETNDFCFDKTIVACEHVFRDVAATARLAVQQTTKDQDAWQAEILALLNAVKDSGTLGDWNQVAFLYRSVRHQRVLELSRYLEAHGIPVYSPRSNMFFVREEVRLVIGALIFLFPQFANVRQWDDRVVLPIWAYYDNECFKMFASALREPENKPLLEWARTRAKQHLALAQNTDYAFSGLLYEMLQFSLFSKYLDEQALRGPDKGRAARNLSALSRLLTQFEYLHHVNVLNPDYLARDIRSLFNQFLRFLFEGGIGEYEDPDDITPPGCVSFLTIHQAKGLEFPIVICDSLDSVPRAQNRPVYDLLESGGHLRKNAFEPASEIKFFDFWRLYYTAFSRAQNLLILAAEERQQWPRSPSQYFAGMFYALPRWQDIDLTRVRLEPVKRPDLKREYSFTTDVLLYENCPEQYRFFRALDFAAIRLGPVLFGTLVHQTIEDIHKAVLRGEESEVTPGNIESWFSTNYTMLAKREGVYLSGNSRNAALRHIIRYYEREKGRWDRIREAEFEISLVKERYILKGSIDLIRAGERTVDIVDFKAERKPDMEKDRIRIERYRRQLEVYAHIVEQRTGLTVDKLHIYYTGEDDGNPYVSFRKDERAIDHTMAQFDEVVRKIEAKDYSMHSRPVRLCQDCDMRPYCDNKTWIFKEVQ